ncbi:MAG: S-ribosylhomocysteine lyase [Oscillospiraceae bacterium]|nr:S-ribosylhomocysteine lyase [Oscillospiraceae bacterium]
MNTIASFTVNHDTLQPGMYVSRIDGDVVTYDIRMKRPNHGDYLSTGTAHSLEHLFATLARNSAWADRVLYVGPMGCRTGFYLLLRDSVSRADAIRLVRDCFAQIAVWDGAIPGATRAQCGNYQDQDLDGAKAEAAALCDILRHWTEEKLNYEG